MSKMISARGEYPRPDFIREQWELLNGEWEFSFDRPVFDRKILVPFCYQSKKSGIGETEDHDTVWYRRNFVVEGSRLQGHRLLLHFGAVDYQAQVWVNGNPAGSHWGGHVPFVLDITELVRNGENELTVQATDGTETQKPRGKQSWTGKRFACWYTPTTGIWQNVWLEYAGLNPLGRIKITPNVTHGSARCELFLETRQPVSAVVRMELMEKGLALGEQTIRCVNGYGQAVFAIPDWDILRHEILWSPESPNLISVVTEIEGGDRVFAYFGMREIQVRNGEITLNGETLFQRLVLDQGYWKETLLTPPDGEALRRDLWLTKAMGFNGARKHQKIEDPRYYYWADRLGLLVWGELPSAYAFTDEAIENSSRELMEFVRRDYNHPCIITWVPVNESWGVRNVLFDSQQQDYCRMLFYLLKSMDATRLVSANDGWEQISQGDVCAVHDYALFANTLSKYDKMEETLAGSVQGRQLYAGGNCWQGQPVLMSEYGGIAFADDSDENWGYFGKVKTEEEFMERLAPVNEFLLRSGKFAGFCYTQLTDVMQETNGLLTENREPKVELEKLRSTFGMPQYQPHA